MLVVCTTLDRFIIPEALRFYTRISSAYSGCLAGADTVERRRAEFMGGISTFAEKVRDEWGIWFDVFELFESSEESAWVDFRALELFRLGIIRVNLPDTFNAMDKRTFGDVLVEFPVTGYGFENGTPMLLTKGVHWDGIRLQDLMFWAGHYETVSYTSTYASLGDLRTLGDDLSEAGLEPSLLRLSRRLLLVASVFEAANRLGDLLPTDSAGRPLPKLEEGLRVSWSFPNH